MDPEHRISEQPAAGLNAAPLFHVAWLFALGIVAAKWLWLRPSLVLIALAAIAILCTIAAWRALRIAWLPMALLWLLLGSWCAEMQPQPAPARQLDALSDGLLRTVEGTVIATGPVRTQMEQNLDRAASAELSQRLDLRVASLEVVNDAEDKQTPVQGNVRVTVRWPEDAATPRPFACGDRVRAVVRLLPPEVYRDPGVWSRTDYLLDQGITSSSSVKAAEIERLGTSRGTSLSCRMSTWQHATAVRLLALPAKMQWLSPALRLNMEDAAMLAAMVAGDRTYLTQHMRVGFERTGSFHMLVVSGFHLAVVAGCLFWILRKLRLPRAPATLLTIGGSVGYALFTGFATPVQRALWMIAIYLIGRLVYRERNAVNTIGFAALCLLVVSPRSLFDASFQMTLLAVVAIAGVAVPLLAGTIHPYLVATRELNLTVLDAKLAPPIAQFRVELRMIAARLANIGSNRLGWRIFPWVVGFALRVVELIVVSCVVELAMTLPMAIYFHRITLFALPVNLLILPLLAVLLPAALLMLLLLIAWPAAALLPGVVVALVLHAGVWLVHIFGSLQLGNLRTATPLLWQTAAFCCCLAAAIALAHRGRRTQWMAWAALLLAGVVAVLPRPIQHPRDALLVEAIDVGQGDSLLLITPDGKTLLVDGGGFAGGPRSTPPNFDIGEEVVSPALWARGIRRLDAVVITHAHSDHIGGLPSVLRNFHPASLWVGNNPPIAAYEALLQEAAALHVQLRSFRAGDSFEFGGTRVDVLAPMRNYQPGPEPSNNNSLVLHVSYGATSVMLEGDAEAPVEDAMLAEHGLESTLLKVGHHGSNTSTRPEFLARVAPQWAVISCGLHNPYQHPRQQVLEELQAAHVGTFITAVNGVMCFRLNGKSAVAEPECAFEENSGVNSRQQSRQAAASMVP